MPEPLPSEDKAALYLLGGLTATERRDFEIELAQSAELRALVRELEESAVLLARSSPQRRPPPKVWQAIEKNIAAEAKSQKVVPAFWTAWWRHGWVAAAACLVGWVLYAFWINRQDPINSSRPRSEMLSQNGLQPGDTSSTPPPTITVHSPDKANPSSQPTQVQAMEIIRLRHRLAELESNVSRLSQSVAQQQALLGESNRLKFAQLTLTSAGNSNTTPAPLSPALQRAIYFAMARELGWLSASDASPSTGPDNIAQPLLIKPTNIDFVDLHPSTNTPSSTPQPQSVQAPVHPSTEATPPTSPAIAIPSFTSGDNVVVAIDQTIAPTGTQINFLNQNQQPIGTTVLGDNPMVVTIPTSVYGWPIFITTGSLINPGNIFQFPPANTNSP